MSRPPRRSARTRLPWARKLQQSAGPAGALKLRAVEAGIEGPQTSRGAVRSPQDAVQLSPPILRTGASRVMSDGGCVACHAAADDGDRLGARVASRLARRPTDDRSHQDHGRAERQRSRILQGRESGGQPDSQLCEIFMMAAMKLPPTVATDAWTYYLAAKQRRQAIGTASRRGHLSRTATINRTALAIRALTVPARRHAKRSWRLASIVRLRGWPGRCRSALKERIMQLLGLTWADVRRPLREISRASCWRYSVQTEGGHRRRTWPATCATGQALLPCTRSGCPRQTSRSSVGWRTCCVHRRRTGRGT